MDGGDSALGLVVGGAYVACSAWCGIVLRRLVVPSWRGPLALLGTTILALSVFVVVAELLGAVALFRRWALLAGLLVAAAVAAWLDRRSTPGSDPSTGASRSGRLEPTEAVVLGAALAIAFEPYLRRVGTVYRRGMLEWDTHWYHAPVAARFAETGDLTQLHAVNNSADSFLPFNTELLHAAGMLATGRGRPLAADQPRLACARRARGVVPRPRLERRRRGRRGDGGRGDDSRDGLRVCGGPPGTTSPGSRCCSPPRRSSSAARRRRGWRGSPGSPRGSRWGRS